LFNSRDEIIVVVRRLDEKNTAYVLFYSFIAASARHDTDLVVLGGVHLIALD